MKKLATLFGAVLVAVLAFSTSAAAQTTAGTPAAAETPAAEVATRKKVTIRAAEIAIADAFTEIERQTGLSIAYGRSAIDVKRRIALSLDGAAFDRAMTEVLRGTDLTYKINGYHVILTPRPEPPKPQPRRNVTVSGRVTDAATGEAIIGGMVFEGVGERGATTNAYGFYSLTLPAGTVKLRASMLGYGAWERAAELTRDTTLDIALAVAATAIDEVVVISKDQNPLTSGAGAVSVPIARIRNSPALMGESDMMKSLQYIPGVQGGAEGKADLSVRGGSPDQNLILLDGNPIYNANHLFGFVSVFNTDALKNVTLYKGGFPARFGGRLSSVIDINTKDGDKQRFGGSATLGLLAAKFNLEGPIVKDRTSFTLSGRRSWADTFMGKLQESEEMTTIVKFYDVNAKLHHKISDRTSVYLTAYNGHDRLRNTEEYIDGALHEGMPEGSTPVLKGYDSFGRQEWQWGSTIVTARLASALAGNLFMNANLSFNRYRYNTFISERQVYTEASGRGGEEVSDRIDYDSGIGDYTATLDVEYIPSPRHYIRAGVQGVMHDFRPETMSFRGENNVSVAGGKIPATEVALYAEDDWDVARRLTLGVGARASMFRVHGKTYGGIDPRLSATFRASDRVSVKASYARMQQYIHLLSNNSLLLQTDLWVPTTGRIKPMNSAQYSLGAYVAFPRLFDLSVEGYYKDMTGVLEYRDGSSFYGSSTGWEDKVEAGIGRAYGVEIALERRVGRTTGSLSYAWAKSERRFSEINFGEWFPARYDRRHTVNVIVTHTLSKKIDLSLAWTYCSGEMITLPMMSGAVVNMDQGGFNYINGDHYQLDGRNNYRAPAYHRLDVGMKFHPRRWRSPERYGEWSFGVYNAYNRMNAFKLYLDTWTYEGRTMLGKMTLFPVLPSVSYTYNF